MNENRTRRSTAAWLLVVALVLLAPAVSRAEVGFAVTLGLHAPRVAHILGVIDEGADPVTNTMRKPVAPNAQGATAGERAPNVLPNPGARRGGGVPSTTTRSRITSQ